MDAKQIMMRLLDHGFEAYIVGGYVRDHLLGKPSTDIDLVTNARINDLDSIFHDVVRDRVGAQFSVLLISGIQVASYRADSYHGLDAHDVVVVPVDTLEEDLARRDLTINSIAMDIDGNIIDPFNGYNDLINEIIRFTGDPASRILEDPNRILRTARFMCMSLGMSIASETRDALIRHAQAIEYIKPERVRLEILKTMRTVNPRAFFDTLASCNALEYIFPELHFTIGYDGGPYHAEDIYTHSMLVGTALSPKHPLLRLTGFLHDVGKPRVYEGRGDGTFVDHDIIGAQFIHDALGRLRFSASERNYSASLIALHMRKLVNASSRTIRHSLAVCASNKVPVNDLLRFHIADRIGNLARVPYTLKEIRNSVRAINDVLRGPAPRALSMLAVNGHDIMQHFNLSPSPIIGKVLNELLTRTLDDPDINTRDKLLEVARSLVN